MAGRNIWGLKQLRLQMLCKRGNFEAICRRWSSSTSSQVHENCKASLLKKLNAKIPEESDNVCIYQVPAKLRQVEAEAYDPSILSIGPYHRGDRHLKEMEELKLKFFHRVFRSKQESEVELERVISAMEELEPKARSCYADEVKLSRDEFVDMMVIDGCFILQLLREVGSCRSSSSLVQRWMLPTLRRDLIKLENQLPMIVLRELLDMIDDSSQCECSVLSLQDLALKFFNPLLQRDSHMNAAGATASMNRTCHFLDLFRSSILPEIQDQDRKRQPRMIQSITELTEAGVMLEKPQNDRALDIRSEGRVLKIPPLHIDDHRGTLFRNMVAFEQCHKKCKPDATAYVFFFDGLVNSAGDVEILHYKGIVHHSLGSNKEAANLVNKLCKEVDWDGEESYLHKVVCDDIDVYFMSRYAKLRARLVHYYFSNWVVGISTVAGLFALYLTLIQTGCGVADSLKALKKNSFWAYLSDSFSLLFSRPSTPLPDPEDSNQE
ncbi:UPF0481 protein At3g47200-like [Rhodamnia argentea]|uniref:UPF0481 protein At3g47200-like n=1 Tax=Rhodamnia argentea TaxID=178133 RepID=A0ABM3H6E3_9MYRT|nr:UPF0481 protein At3g47200-like [Rhodamnia argentea]